MQPQAEAGNSARLFVFGWGFAVAFHQFWLGYWVRSPIDAVVSLLALAVCLFPRTGQLFLVFLVAHLADFLYHLPYGWNHEVLGFVIEVQLLGSALHSGWQTRSSESDATRIASGAASAIRLSYVTLYCLVTLHKLNSDFLFNLDLSCGNAFFQRFALNYPWLNVPVNQWTGYTAIAITIASEALIPILLSLPRARRIGVIWAYAFHTLVGATSNTDFNVFAFVILTLFFPESWQDALLRRLRSIFAPWQTTFGSVATRTAVAIGLMLAAVALTEFIRLPRQDLRWTFALAGIAFLAFLITRAPADSLWFDRRKRFFKLRPYEYAAQLVLILCGLSPYLGLRSEGSFAMFSNLATEGTYANHLFMPVLRIRDYQDDLVEVLDTDDPALLNLTDDKNRLLVFFEFQKRVRRSVAHGDDFSVTFVSNGEVQGPVSQKSLVSSLRAYHEVEERLLWFRSIPKDRTQNVCIH